MVMPPPTHPPVPGDVVSPDVPIGVKTGLPVVSELLDPQGLPTHTDIVHRRGPNQTREAQPWP